MEEEIKGLLERVLPKLKANPELMQGRGGISTDLVEKMKSEEKIPIERLSWVAGDHLFDDDHDKFDITQNEGQRLRAYFAVIEPEEYDELKELFPYLE